MRYLIDGIILAVMFAITMTLFGLGLKMTRETCIYKEVTTVFVCNSVSNGFLSQGISKCRVEFKDGSRVTVRGLHAVGDTVRFPQGEACNEVSK